ncbi:MAG: hypothetical protein IKZ19_10040 [Clostridia bacterium]|nr:hypothetical protein [Clostridia bacterium]
MEIKLTKTDNNTYVTALSCTKGTRSLAINFSRSCNVSLAYISSEGVPLAVCALSGEFYSQFNTAYCNIPTLEKDAPISVSVDGNAVLHSVELSDSEYLFRSDYVPTPQTKLLSVNCDSWEATDMLGRKVSSVEDVGAKNNRKVGIFYWTWHEEHSNLRPVNVTKVLDQFPAAEYRLDHPAWGERPMQCFWNEPLYGFYKNTDPYVIRRHMSLLAGAGVDFLMFDCTNNALVWRTAYEALLREMHLCREEGLITPQIGFILNFWPHKDSEKMLRALYQNLYKPGLYRDLWFCIDGKPVIMAYPEALPAEGINEEDTKLLNEIREFFAFRPGQPLYGGGPTEGRNDQWGWLEKAPQNKYRVREDGSCEMMTVGVAQNCNAERICTHFNDKATFGRSYTDRHKHGLLSPQSYKYGYNFQEQWDRVVDIGPDIAFVTGWNEWIMGQWHEPWLSDNDSTQLAMVDQYNREHSRDIEPDKDGYLDTYYLQLASNIRRFKGATQREKVSPPKTINIRRSLRQWADVTPLYENLRGTAVNRDWDGFGGTHYVNTSIKNQIVSAKVTGDSENIYFLVTCAGDLTPPTDSGWMTLFIDSDRNKSTGWEGYDYVINRHAPKNWKTVVEKDRPTAEIGSFTWEKIGSAFCRVYKNTLQLALPRNLLNSGEKLNFEFKWSDNMQESSVMDFYVNGNTAPIGRFNYLFRE